MDDNRGGQLLADARQSLELGFYVDNLNHLANLFRQMVLATRWPSSCFILHEVAVAIAHDWDRRPMTSPEVMAVESQLRPRLEALLDGMSEGRTAPELQILSDQLVLSMPKVGK